HKDAAKRSAGSRTPRRPGVGLGRNLYGAGRRAGLRDGIGAGRGHLTPLAAAHASLAPRDRHVVALRRPGIELARPADLLVRVLDHFLPLGAHADVTPRR